MPNINQIKTSKFLTKEDVGKGMLLTIKGCTQQSVAMQGQVPEMKFCLHFVESEKPMVLASVNAQLIASFLGSPETDHWIGRRIVAYCDPTIMFQGQLKGGIRVRAPKPEYQTPAVGAVPAAAPVAAPVQQPVAQPAVASAAAAGSDPDEPKF